MFHCSFGFDRSPNRRDFKIVHFLRSWKSPPSGGEITTFRVCVYRSPPSGMLIGGLQVGLQEHLFGGRGVGAMPCRGLFYIHMHSFSLLIDDNASVQLLTGTFSVIAVNISYLRFWGFISQGTNDSWSPESNNYCTNVETSVKILPAQSVKY